MFGATNTTKNSDEKKWIRTGYGMAFNGGGLWSSGHDFAGNAAIFGDNNWSSHADNRKNDFLVLGVGPIYDINGSFGAAEKKSHINFTKTKTRFCLSFQCNIDNSYLFVNKKEICKTDNGIINFPTDYCLQSISKGFSAIDSRSYSF